MTRSHMTMKKNASVKILSAALALAAMMTASCNKSDIDISVLTSTEVKVVVDGQGEAIDCPFCGKKIGYEKYHHHLCPAQDKCPVEGCEYNGKNHRHCFYNGTGVCPGHERGHGGMGGGSYN